MKKIPAVLALVLATSTAAAQTAAPAGYVPLHVQDPVPNANHKLLDERGRELAECTGECTFMVLPGQYKLRVSGNMPTTTRRIAVVGDTSVAVSPGSSAQRWIGLSLGIIGPVVTIAAAVAAIGTTGGWHGDTRSSHSSSQSDSDSDTGLTVLALAGVAATIGGWVAFGTSGTTVDTTAVAPVTVSVAPTRDGATAGLRFSF